MPAFELFQPTSVADAQALLDRYGAGAWVLAGGLDSFDWLKDRIKRPAALVDLGGIAELKGIRAWQGGLEIGAMTTLTEVVRHPEVRERYSILLEAAEAAASPRFATRGRSAATCHRTRAAGTTARDGRVIAPAATSATPTRRMPSIGSTRFSRRIAASPSVPPIPPPRSLRSTRRW